MKKTTLLFAFVAGSALLFGGCDKIKEKISEQVDPFNFTQQTIEMELPPVTSTAAQTSTGIDTVDIDLDKIIKDNTPKSMNLGINNVQSLTLEKITVTLLDHDKNNYLANFDKVEAYVNSNTGIQMGKNDIYMSAWCNDIAYNAADQSIVINGDPKMELIDYLKGNKVYYWFKARARRTTNKTLRVKMVIDYKLVPKL